MFLFTWQMVHIPTMQNGPDLAKRFYKELTDIQVRREGATWWRQTGAAPPCLQFLDLLLRLLKKTQNIETSAFFKESEFLIQNIFKSGFFRFLKSSSVILWQLKSFKRFFFYQHLFLNCSSSFVLFAAVWTHPKRLGTGGSLRVVFVTAP